MQIGSVAQASSAASFLSRWLGVINNSANALRRPGRSRIASMQFKVTSFVYNPQPPFQHFSAASLFEANESVIMSLFAS